MVRARNTARPARTPYNPTAQTRPRAAYAATPKRVVSSRQQPQQYDDWSDTESSVSRSHHRRPQPDCGKDCYDWNKCLPPSCYPTYYPNTISIPIMNYGYNAYPTYSYAAPFPVPMYGNCYGNGYSGYPGYAGYPAFPNVVSSNNVLDTICSPQGCTTISQPVVTSCSPVGCVQTYGPPNVASISDTVFKRNLFV